MADLSFDTFLATHTQIAAPPLCPEVSLHLGDELDTTWEQQEAWVAQRTAAPPYWSVAWIGGQALARYMLDNPAHFEGRSLLDFGSGSGLCAIAAAKVGASAFACDIDPHAIAAITINSRLNDVHVTALREDLIGTASRWSVVVAGDLWYDGHLARQLTPWLRRIASEGTEVLLGDCGRAHFPRNSITELQRYEIAAPESLERRSVNCTAVWRLE